MSLSPVHSQEIQNQLDKILRSKVFARSPRQCEFLRFVVGEFLAGRGDALKEISIGTEVFRGSYDPAKDTLVRVTPSRVRNKLAAYYQTEGQGDPWVIELPPEGYVPRIAPRQAATPSDQAINTWVTDPSMQGIPATPRYRRVAAALVGMLGAASLGSWIPLQKDPVPRIMAYRPLTEDGRPKLGLTLLHRYLYFEEEVRPGAGYITMSVPESGGEAAPAPTEAPSYSASRTASVAPTAESWCAPGPGPVRSSWRPSLDN